VCDDRVKSTQGLSGDISFTKTFFPPAPKRHLPLMTRTPGFLRTQGHSLTRKYLFPSRGPGPTFRYPNVFLLVSAEKQLPSKSLFHGAQRTGFESDPLSRFFFSRAVEPIFPKRSPFLLALIFRRGSAGEMEMYPDLLRQERRPRFKGNRRWSLFRCASRSEVYAADIF